MRQRRHSDPGNDVVLLISGILGPKREGNQSLKNTVLGLLRSGYSVYHFTQVALSDESHQYEELLRFPRYHPITFPRLYLSALQSLNRPSRRARKQPAVFPPMDAEIDLGETEISWQQTMVVAASTVIELVRVPFYALLLRPSLVYGYEIYGAFAASIVGRLCGARTVLRFQGTYVTVRNIRSRNMRIHTRALGLPCDGVVMANDGTKGDAILRRLGVSPERIYHEPNGLDDQVAEWSDARNPEAADLLRRARSSLNTSGSRFLLGVFTRFYPYKRIDRAIALVRMFRQQGASVHLALGGGGGPLEAPLKALIKELEVEEYVTWCGRIPYSQMVAHYLACDAVLVLNDYANTGNQILECIHLGVPLVAVDDAVNSRLFGDCPYAWFVRTADLPGARWQAVADALASRGCVYDSSHIRSWRERMRDEILWIQGLPAGGARTESRARGSLARVPHPTQAPRATRGSR